MIIETQAYARAGLLGNPSDGYFGKTISISVKNFGALISLYETPELCIELQKEDSNIFQNITEFIESVNSNGYYGGDRLIKAAIKKFYEYCKSNNIKINNKNFTIRYFSSIPRQVGLAGSSAIITAVFRALMIFFKVEIPKPVLPSIVLSVEKEELGINAGLQDRVIQTYEGCMYMDFDQSHIRKHNHGKYIPIDVSLLPNIYIGYKVELSKVSGTVLNDVQTKYNKGDKVTIDTLDEIAGLAEKGREMIETKKYNELFELINLNFDLRTKIMNISPSNLEMIDVARKCGASAKFTGSGGAIIGTYSTDEMLTKLIINLKKINVRVIKPYIS